MVLKNYFCFKAKATGTESYTEKTAVVSNIRHYSALQRAMDFLESARNSIDQKLTGEFVALDLRNAENSLGEIIGKITSDDI
jgi:tRNA modification GTPase